MVDLKNLPHRVATDLVAQLIALGIFLVLAWVGGLVSSLPAWAYVPLSLVVIGLSFWVLNNYMEAFRRLTANKPLELNMSGEHAIRSDNTESSELTHPQKHPSQGRFRAANGEVFNDSVVSVLELVAEDDHVVANCIFKSCILVGPAVILPKNIRLLPKTSFHALTDIRDALIEAQKGQRLSGVLAFDNCTFENCKFKYIAFIADKETIQKFMDSLE